MPRSNIQLGGQELKLDADADTSITVDTDDQIDIKIAGSDSLRIKANEIENVSGNFTLDVVGGIIIDADGGEVQLHDGGTEYVQFKKDSNDVQITAGVQDGDIVFRGNDGGSMITAMTIDMSAGGNVGIGTTSPSSALHVDSSNDGPIFDSGGTGNTNHALLVRDSGNNQLLRVNNNGKVGIGTTSPSRTFHVSSSSGTAVKVETSDNDKALIEFTNNGTSTPCFLGSADDAMQFGVGGSERMRINNDGSLFINHASDAHPVVGTERLGVVAGTGSTAVGIACSAGHATGVGLFVSSTPDGAVDFVKFASGSGGSTRGLIEFDSSNMSYGSTSDYRLKENVATYTKGIETLKKLNPIAFTWKESKVSDIGFLAHEVAEIHPNAVSGDKDGMETVAGEEKIRPQMLDPSKLVGILTGALQEAIAKIETLEAKVTALEGS
jgi:hypothetical protein